MVYIILTAFKVLICFIGFGFSAFYFFSGLKQRDNTKMKKAGFIFLGTWVIVIFITVIEFAII